MNAYFVKADPKSTAKIDIRYCCFAGTPYLESGHIYTEGDTAYVREVTLFPGNLTRWGAVKWGALGILRLGPDRIKQIKKWLTFGGWRK